MHEMLTCIHMEVYTSTDSSQPGAHCDRLLLCDTDSPFRSQASSAAVSGSLKATGATTMDTFSNKA